MDVRDGLPGFGQVDLADVRDLHDTRHGQHSPRSDGERTQFRRIGINCIQFTPSAVTALVPPRRLLLDRSGRRSASGDAPQVGAAVLVGGGQRPDVRAERDSLDALAVRVGHGGDLGAGGDIPRQVRPLKSAVASTAVRAEPGRIPATPPWTARVATGVRVARSHGWVSRSSRWSPASCRPGGNEADRRLCCPGRSGWPRGRGWRHPTGKWRNC